MFEPAFADITQKFLQMRNMHDAGAAKSLQRIVGERTFADITADLPFAIIRRNAGKTHRAGLHSSYACAKRIFLAYCPGNDLLEIHAHILEEMLGKIAAVETYRRMDWSFFCAMASSSFMRAIRPRITERSMVSMEMPLASRIFSLYRTVLNAAGRAPIAPMRNRRKPFTTRHTPRNHSRSRRKMSDCGCSVWSVVNE